MTLFQDPAWSWLGLTLAAELALAAVFHWRDAARRSIVLAVLAVNLMSFPAALFAHASGAPWMVVELAVIGFEAAAIARLVAMRPSRAVGLSIALNSLTAGMGWLISL